MSFQDDGKRHITLDIWIPRCPACGSSSLHHYGTRINAKSETIRYYLCRNSGCKTKFPGRVMNADDDDPGEGTSDCAIPPETK